MLLKAINKVYLVTAICKGTHALNKGANVITPSRTRRYLSFVKFRQVNGRRARDRLYPTSQAGDKLPDATVYEGKPDNKVKVRDVFKGKKGVLFGVPGELAQHVAERRRL